MSAYYNENDPANVAWLRELIAAGLIADGEIDERSIEEVQPEDVRGFTQCHFFAGVGVWSYALRFAGWPDDRPIWTGSCPCPSFSAAGKGEGFEDARHLWPAWYRLIRKSRPPTVFGEQVESAIGFGWIDLVQVDLEAAAYSVGKAVLGACSVGAPHRRQRLYFVADSASTRHDNAREHGSRSSSLPARLEQHSASLIGSSEQSRLERHFGNVREWRGPGWLDPITARSVAEAGATRGFWSDCDWWFGRDGKYRPIGQGIAPLAGPVKSSVLALAAGTTDDLGLLRDSGLPEIESGEARQMRLRGYGNAICAEVAKEFIQAYMGLKE